MKDIMIYVVWIAVLSLTTVLGNAQTVVIKDLNTATVENRSLYLSVNAEKELSKEGNAYANRDKKPKDLPKNRFTYYPFYYNFYFQSSGMERLDFKARNLNCKLDYKYAVYEKEKKGRLK